MSFISTTEQEKRSVQIYIVVPPKSDNELDGSMACLPYWLKQVDKQQSGAEKETLRPVLN